MTHSWLATLQSPHPAVPEPGTRLPPVIAAILMKVEAEALEGIAAGRPLPSGVAKQTQALGIVETEFLDPLGITAAIRSDHPELEILGRQLLETGFHHLRILAHYLEALQRIHETLVTTGSPVLSSPSPGE